MATIAPIVDSGKPRQLDLFYDHLPTRPRCADYLPGPTVVREKMDAVSRLHIQANGPTHLYWLIYDIDRPTAMIDWSERNMPAPNIIVGNPDNGHAHLLYGLEVPVRKAPDAQLKPLRYAAAVERALLAKVDGDYGYAGLICKNPLHPHWIVQTPQDFPYSLTWLADYVDLRKVDFRTKADDYGLGRNCTIFNSLRQWAYRNRRHFETFPAWHIACLERATSYNTFPAPLPFNEIKSTAKSVAKWVWENQAFSKAGFSAIQTKRGKSGGKKSGEVRREKAKAKQGLLFGYEGLPSSVVASMTGIPERTVRYLRSQMKKPAP